MAVPLSRAVARVRRFNRFYTRQVGALDEGHLHSRFNLAEARVLYEIAHRDRPAAVDLIRELKLDPGYLSRLLRGLVRRGLLTASVHQGDGRRRVLSLTALGRREQSALERRAGDDMAAMLSPLAVPDREQLLVSLRSVERLLGAPAGDDRRPVTLRRPRVGELGWVVQR
ncbi:MAG: MarR family winged helix-turn-helix transcriptional regulator, partial [Gemmatimonadales bacterium]